ncbi:hypothetical protein ACLI4Y_11340 [Natrialbaceae archaeon A-CW3]
MNRSAVATVILAALLTVSLVGAAGVGASTTAESAETTSSSEAYAGTHLAFEASGNAVTDYTVDGETLFSSVTVDSQSEVDGGADAAIDLGAVVDISGAGLSIGAQSQTATQIEAESGATLSAHDNERGHLVVNAGSESQVVEAQVDGNAQASAEGDDRVVVESDTRNGVFLVVGDGEVTVNEEGDVVASLESESTLVFRSYADGERDDQAKDDEQLIADGSAAAEVYVDVRDGEAVADTVSYGEETAVEARQEGEQQVEVIVDRAISEGTIVLTTVEEEAVGTLENLEVRVDGEAAVEASSQSELESAIGGDESAYMVSQHAEAEAKATVYVAFNHFSERTASIGAADDADSTDDGVADGLPGFGALAALLGLGAGVGARLRQ